MSNPEQYENQGSLLSDAQLGITTPEDIAAMSRSIADNADPRAMAEYEARQAAMADPGNPNQTGVQQTGWHPAIVEAAIDRHVRRKEATPAAPAVPPTVGPLPKRRRRGGRSQAFDESRADAMGPGVDLYPRFDRDNMPTQQDAEAASRGAAAVRAVLAAKKNA